MAIDFMYDKELLSDYDMMLCQFENNNGIEIVSMGNNLQFNTIQPAGSDSILLVNAKYEEQITFTIQICKRKCNLNNADMQIMPEEMSLITRWLVRKDKYYPFKILQDGYEDIFFRGSFNNPQVIKIAGVVYGLELTFISDSPYAYLDTVYQDFSTDSTHSYSLIDMSHEIGHIYPSVFTCKCLESGDLQIVNAIENRVTEIKGCIKDEIITLDGIHKIISSNVPTHKLYNDFNYNYFRIANTYWNKKNIISTSISCDIYIEYNPIRKVSIG